MAEKPDIKSNIPTRHNNPLNLKYGGLTSKYVDSGDAELGEKAKDGGRFLKFKTPELGFSAAKDLLFNNFYKDLDVDSAMKKWSNQGYGAKKIAPHIKSTALMSSLGEEDKDHIVNNMAKHEGFKAENIENTKDIETGEELKNYKITNNKTGEVINASFKAPPTQEDVKKIFSTRAIHQKQKESSEEIERNKPFWAKVADYAYAPSEAIAPEVMAPEEVEKLPTGQRLLRLGQETASGLVSPENLATAPLLATGAGAVAVPAYYGAKMLMDAPSAVKQAMEHPSIETVGRAGILGAGILGAGLGVKSGVKRSFGMKAPQVEAPPISAPRAPISRQIPENAPIDAEFVESPSNRMPGREQAQISGNVPYTEEGAVKTGASTLEELQVLPPAPIPKQITGEITGEPIKVPPSSIEEELGTDQITGRGLGETKQLEPYYHSTLVKKATRALLAKREGSTGKVRQSIDDILRKRGALPDETEEFPIEKTVPDEPTEQTTGPTEELKKENIEGITPEKVIEVQKPPAEGEIGKKPEIENAWLIEQDTSVLQAMLPGARGQMAREINTVLNERGIFPEKGKVIKVEESGKQITEEVPTETETPKNITYKERTSRTPGKDQHIVFADGKFDSSHPTFEAAQARAKELGGEIQPGTGEPTVSKPTSEKPLSLEEQLRQSIEAKKKIPAKIEEQINKETQASQFNEESFKKYTQQLDDLVSHNYIESQHLQDLARIGKESGLDMDTIAQDMIDNTPRINNNVNRVWAAVKKAFKEEKGSADFPGDIGNVVNRIVRKARGTESEEPINDAVKKLGFFARSLPKPESRIGEMGDAGLKLKRQMEDGQYQSASLKGKVDILAHDAFKNLTPREIGQRIAILDDGKEIPLNKDNMDKYVDWNNGTYKPKSGVQRIVRSRGSLSDVMLDNATPMNDKVAQAAPLFKQMRDILGEEAEMAGVNTITPSGKKIPFTKLGQDNWPRSYTDGFYKSLENDPNNWSKLAKKVATEKEITVDEALEFLKNKKIYSDITNRGQQQQMFKQDSFVIDPEAVFDHINSFTGRIGMAKAFGPEDIAGSLVKKELIQLQNEGFDYEFARDTIDRLTGREGKKDLPGKTESTIYKAVTDLNNARLMTSFIINNLANVTTTVARVGPVNTMRGLGAMLGNLEMSRRMATLSGATEYTGVIERSGSTLAKGLGIPQSERFMRTWADQSGRKAVEQLVDNLNREGISKKRFAMDKELLDSLLGKDSTETIQRGNATPEELQRAGWQLAKDSQGIINPATMPPLFENVKNPMFRVGANLALQYKRMAALGMNSLVESFKLNPARTITTMAIIAPIVGEVVGDAGSALFGSLAGTITGEGAAKAAIRDVKDRGESLRKVIKPLLQDKFGLSEAIAFKISRGIDDLNRGFALGLIGDFLYSVAYWGGKAGADTVSGGISPAFEFAYEIVKDIMNDAEDIIVGIPAKRTGIGDIKKTVLTLAPQRISTSIQRSEREMKGHGSSLIRFPSVRPPRLP